MNTAFSSEQKKTSDMVRLFNAFPIYFIYIPEYVYQDISVGLNLVSFRNDIDKPYEKG